jgi:hypothetical protein
LWKHGAEAGSGTFFGESIFPTLSIPAENMYLTLLLEVLLPVRRLSTGPFRADFENPFP